LAVTHRAQTTPRPPRKRTQLRARTRGEPIEQPRTYHGPSAAADVGPRPTRGTPAGHSARTALRPDVRRGVRAGQQPVRPPAGRRPLLRGPHRLRLRHVRDLLGVDQLLVVRLGVRHRRLGLPAGHDGADDRRDHPGTGPAAGVPVARRGRPHRQRNLGRRLRGDAGGDAIPVATPGRIRHDAAPARPTPSPSVLRRSAGSCWFWRT
jgi:hypothetical protein